jgi:hypoxanthine phosphoribosyltransferase
VAELGAQLAADYADREPVLVSVLKGLIIFLADLVRAMPVHVSIDLMGCPARRLPSEPVRILKDLSGPIRRHDVVVVEDIIDTGLTLNYLLKYLHDRGPSSVRICCLLDKPARRLAEIDISYRGFIPDRFVSATAWTTTSATATCPTSACCGHRSTAHRHLRAEPGWPTGRPAASGCRSCLAACS